MVHKIMKKNSFIFFEALVITLMLLIAGFYIGHYLEASRTNKIIQGYKDFEVKALDLKLQNYFYQILEKKSCKDAIEEHINFADKLYEQGLIIQKYEDANQITEDLLLEKKRYVLLKTELWLNSIILKNRCSEPFHTIVYLYTSDAGEVKKSEQEAIANVLKELKEKRGNDIILLPIAGDMDLNAINLQIKNYDVNYFPSVIIDEKYVLRGFTDIKEIEALF